MPAPTIETLERQLTEARAARATRIANLHGLGYSLRLIADLEGVSITTAQNVLRNLGKTPRPRGRPPGPKLAQNGDAPKAG